MSEEFSQEVMDLYESLKEQAESFGYNLNPDEEMTLFLVDGLYRNQERYGYMVCPCRVGEGERERDLDIICPCDYRDADLVEFDQCY